LLRLELWQAVEPSVRLDPHDLIDWQLVDRLSQHRHGEAATWWEQATPGVNYYRARMPAKHLPGRVVRLDTTDIDTSLGFRRQVGAAVWMFPGNITGWLLMAEMRTQGIPVWVEVDDNYTRPSNTPGASGWLTTRDLSGQDLYSFECHRAIVKSKAADGVIVSTRRLAEVYGRLHDNVHVCRNAVDPDDWPELDKPDDGVLRIGWAGSDSHAYDLNDIRPALDWASRQKDVEVVLYGDLTLPVKHTRVKWTDSLEEYRKSLSRLDVMLCPLRPGEWADCKSDVKALEAAMAGGCSVVSRTEPYHPWWEGDAPGYSAATPKEFLKVVKHLVANRDEARETARLAREYALAERNIRQTIREWRDVLC
jgi:Glycosyl transferases group 1